jgi:DNA processing protein
VTRAIGDAEAAAAALLVLPRMRPERLLAILEAWPDPIEALAAIRDGRAREALAAGTRDRDGLVAGWAAGADPARAAARLTAHGARACWTGGPGYPIDDGIDDRPAVMLVSGARPDVLERPRVAVVGTRAASPHGIADAREIGAVLARAGAVVVSGLAIGIDGAAHEGALDAGGAAIAVIATGLDVVYPRRHLALHQRVRATGLLVTEQDFGTRPHPAQFPVRNRIIAALADVTVVVEAVARGGAMSTAQRALDYGRDVAVVPASRRNPAATGSNWLLGQGAHPLLEPEDVLTLLGLTQGSHRTPARRGRRGRGATAEERAVHRALAGEPATADELGSRAGLTPGVVAMAVAGLVRAGHATRAHGLIWPT